MVPTPADFPGSSIIPGTQGADKAAHHRDKGETSLLDHIDFDVDHLGLCQYNSHFGHELAHAPVCVHALIK